MKWTDFNVWIQIFFFDYEPFFSKKEDINPSNIEQHNMERGKWTGAGNHVLHGCHRVFLVGDRQKKCLGGDRKRTVWCLHQDQLCYRRYRRTKYFLSVSYRRLATLGCRSKYGPVSHKTVGTMVDVSQVMIVHTIICKIQASRLTTLVRNESRCSCNSSEILTFLTMNLGLLSPLIFTIKFSITVISVIEKFWSHGGGKVTSKCGSRFSLWSIENPEKQKKKGIRQDSPFLFFFQFFFWTLQVGLFTNLFWLVIKTHESGHSVKNRKIKIWRSESVTQYTVKVTWYKLKSGTKFTLVLDKFL